MTHNNKETDNIAHTTHNKSEISDVLQIHEQGRKYKTLLTKKYQERQVWKEPDPKDILSIIPGSVTSINVKAGDRVKRGDMLMVYEAMKMQNIISAPFDALVKSVNVREGDKLPKGHLLIVLE